jgi:CRISPR-associated protein Cas2
MSKEGQQFMRIMLFFDLPMTTKAGRKNYTHFRQFLLKGGYDMLQFSVYTRMCNGMDQAQRQLTNLSSNLPPKGSVRTLCLTDKQFGRMTHWVGPTTQHEKKVTSEQLVLL